MIYDGRKFGKQIIFCLIILYWKSSQNILFHIMSQVIYILNNNLLKTTDLHLFVRKYFASARTTLTKVYCPTRNEMFEDLTNIECVMMLQFNWFYKCTL